MHVIAMCVFSILPSSIFVNGCSFAQSGKVSERKRTHAEKEQGLNSSMRDLGFDAFALSVLYNLGEIVLCCPEKIFKLMLMQAPSHWLRPTAWRPILEKQ